MSIGNSSTAGSPGTKETPAPGLQRSEIKLFAYALIWNCSYPAGDAGSMLN